jgi:hypothetical protein
MFTLALAMTVAACLRAPTEEPDPGKWETEILYMVADSKGRQ